MRINIVMTTGQPTDSNAPTQSSTKYHSLGAHGLRATRQEQDALREYRYGVELAGR